MRTWDIFFFMLLLSASIAFVNQIGLFNEDYIATPQESEYTLYNLNSLNESLSTEIENKGVVDYLMLGGMILWQGVIMVFNMAANAVVLYPMLVDKFGIPTALAALMQVAFVAITIWGIVQFISGRSGRNIE